MSDERPRFITLHCDAEPSKGCATEWDGEVILNTRCILKITMATQYMRESFCIPKCRSVVETNISGLANVIHANETPGEILELIRKAETSSAPGVSHDD